ncbi:MAG: polysaccharide biosynthesis protein [Thermodesulfovibrionales bacterium]|nr:polysaccharide biosynthesis protein [Thermodesulfovibrionales bacterium]
MLNNKTILISGGSGSLGHALVERICTEYSPKKLFIFSRDEYKQSLMQKQYDYDCLRYFIGDVRDVRRLKQVCRGVDIVIHAAALKRVDTLEYNPTEAIRTNVDGTMNVIETCIECDVKSAVFISTDKAYAPVNLYGATKLAAEKIWLAANSFNKTVFTLVRYGNVINSRGSVIELFLKLKEKGIKEFPITDKNMSRFWITLDEAVDLIIVALEHRGDSDIYIPKVPSMLITEVARAIDPDCTFNEIGIRPGEKLHETLCDGYSSNTNEDWMTPEELLEKL